MLFWVTKFNSLLQGEKTISATNPSSALQGLLIMERIFISDLHLEAIFLTSMSLQSCAGGTALDSGPSTPLPDKKLLLFVLDRLQKCVFWVSEFVFCLLCSGL